ncbi:MAG TPA: 4Fe-4S binding protein [Candidatus Bathyarchaeia archaeon]|nr:4Fe-4S binding protein [Candidatus Bathyarchaeia archaeon]
MAKKNRISPMFKEVLSHLFKKPATGKYPFVKCTVAEGFRGRQVFDASLCVSCGLCSKDCPAKAIEMVEVEGKKLPMFLLDRCIFCYQCAESCPRDAIKSTEFFELASLTRADLVLKPQVPQGTVQKGVGA